MIFVYKIPFSNNSMKLNESGVLPFKSLSVREAAWGGGMSKAWVLTNGETLLNLILVFLFAKGKDWDKYDV